MVAAGLSATRSHLAKNMGLGPPSTKRKRPLKLKSPPQPNRGQSGRGTATNAESQQRVAEVVELRVNGTHASAERCKNQSQDLVDGWSPRLTCAGGFDKLFFFQRMQNRV